MPRLSPPPLRFRFRGRVRPCASEYLGWWGSSSDHLARKLTGPSEPAPRLRKRLQAVSQVSAQPVVWVHQTGQGHRHQFNGCPPSARWVGRKVLGRHSSGGGTLILNYRFSFRVGSGENGAGALTDSRRHQRIQIQVGGLLSRRCYW